MSDGAALAIKKKPRRGMYVLPSLFTAGNIAAGFYAILQSIHGLMGDNNAFNNAALAIAFAAIFDGLDGRVARATNTASDFGREFDSLADVIAFGVAPCLLAYLWGVQMVSPSAYPVVQWRMHFLGMAVCFLFMICGALQAGAFQRKRESAAWVILERLREENILWACRIPAGAMVVAAVIHYESGSPIHELWLSGVWLGLVAFTGFLMVSSWRFWSGKELKFSERQPVRGVLLLAAGLALVIVFSKYALIVCALGYLVSGVLARIAYGWGRKAAV